MLFTLVYESMAIFRNDPKSGKIFLNVVLKKQKVSKNWKSMYIETDKSNYKNRSNVKTKF